MLEHLLHGLKSVWSMFWLVKDDVQVVKPFLVGCLLHHSSHWCKNACFGSSWCTTDHGLFTHWVLVQCDQERVFFVFVALSVLLTPSLLSFLSSQFYFGESLHVLPEILWRVSFGDNWSRFLQAGCPSCRPTSRSGSSEWGLCDPLIRLSDLSSLQCSNTVGWVTGRH